MWTLNPINNLSSNLDSTCCKFLVDLHDPHYVSTLYNIERHEGEPLIRRGAGAKTFFTEASCRQTTYKCRLQNQFIQLKREATKIN